MRPLLILTGATAAGKTSIGVALARELDGEVVSADSVAVYRGLDIGSDKPDARTRADIPHHLIDVCDPRTRFSAGDFGHLATTAIDDITDRGRTPIVVGGTLFYIRALVHGLFPAPPRDPKTTRRLNLEWSTDPSALFQRLEQVDPDTAAEIGSGDRQRIVRALEYVEQTGIPISTARRDAARHRVFRPFMAVVQRPPETLYARIDQRVDMMFSGGLTAEISRLLASGIPHDAHALKAIGYRQGVQCIRGEMTEPEAIEDSKRTTRAFARRQMSSIRREYGALAAAVAPGRPDTVSDLADRYRVFATESG